MITDLLALWPAYVLFLAGWLARDALCRYREYQEKRRHRLVHHPHVKSRPPRNPR